MASNTRESALNSLYRWVTMPWDPKIRTFVRKSLPARNIPQEWLDEECQATLAYLDIPEGAPHQNRFMALAVHARCVQSHCPEPPHKANNTTHMGAYWFGELESMVGFNEYPSPDGQHNGTGVSALEAGTLLYRIQQAEPGWSAT